MARMRDEHERRAQQPGRLAAGADGVHGVLRAPDDEAAAADAAPGTEAHARGPAADHRPDRRRRPVDAERPLELLDLPVSRPRRAESVRDDAPDDPVGAGRDPVDAREVRIHDEAEGPARTAADRERVAVEQDDRARAAPATQRILDGDARAERVP